MLADTAGAITNGFSNVFKLTHRVFCWSHVKRNIDAIQIRPRLPINEFLAQIENDEYFPVEDLEMYKYIADKGKAMTGYECVFVYHDFRYHPKEVTNGAMDDYGYDHFGWYGFTVELWDAPTQAGVKKDDYIQWFRWHPFEDELKLQHWNDENLAGKGFINWQSFEEYYSTHESEEASQPSDLEDEENEVSKPDIYVTRSGRRSKPHWHPTPPRAQF